MENILWILLIIVISILSIYVSIKNNFYAYRFKKLFRSLKSDKTSLFFTLGTKIGVGSIIGTTISIFIGGPGSLFWIWFFSFITISLIYAESFIGALYRRKKSNYTIGGPFFYIKDGLNKKVLAIISLILIIMTYSILFQMIQVNTIISIIMINIDIEKPIIMILLIILLLFIVFFNPKELLTLLNKIVPFMCIFFIIIGLIVIFKNSYLLRPIIISIFKSAFNPSAIITGMVIGVKRSIFLNEIMIGTTSIGASVDDLDKYTSSSIQTIGNYFITFIICTITGFLVLIFRNNINVLAPNSNFLINNVFIYHFGNIGGFILIFLLLLFGVTTVISGYYIGSIHIDYLTNKKYIFNMFRFIFIISCVFGIFLEGTFLWTVVDILMFLMILINSYSIIKLIRK